MSDIYEGAFMEMKDNLTFPAMLAYLDFEMEFRLVADASGEVGAVLE